MPSIDQNDPRLTAYALGEMTDAEQAAFELELRDDPAARTTVAEIRQLGSALAGALAHEPAPERAIEPPRPAAPRPAWWVRLGWVFWVPVVGTAAMALFVALHPGPWRQTIIYNTPPSPTLAEHRLPEPAAEPADAESAVPRASARSAAPVATAELPQPPSRLDLPVVGGHRAAASPAASGHFLAASMHPSSRFSLLVESTAYDSIRRQVQVGRRPAAEAVRIEELLNAFPYRYTTPPAGRALAMQADLQSAPWAPGHRLLRIGLQSRDEPPADARTARPPVAARDVNLEVAFNPTRVAAYRLLGYENAAPASDVARGSDLPAGHQVTALYEIVPQPARTEPPLDDLKTRSHAAVVAATDDWITVKLRYRQPATDDPLEIVESVGDAETTPGADFDFAAAVAGYGLLLQGDNAKGTITWDMVERLAQSGAAGQQSGERTEFLELVRRTRRLAAE